MKNEENIKNLVKKLNDTTSSEMDKRTLNDVFKVLDESTKKPSTTGQNIWRTIMKTKITKLAAAAVIIIAVLAGYICEFQKNCNRFDFSFQPEDFLFL